MHARDIIVCKLYEIGWLNRVLEDLGFQSGAREF